MNKTICLGMIVKNEELTIKQTLESAKSVIDYWIIIDTGSTDNTTNIIKKMMKDIPGELIQRPWKNFGYNRTEVATLTRDKADYTLMLDGDMTVCLNNFNKEELIADAYDIQINWGIIYNLPLLLNNRLEWKSIGYVHEYWQTEGMKSRTLLKTITINHNGNTKERRKGFDDINLLLEGLKNEPNNTRYMFYLCRTYLDLKEYEKTIEWGEKRIAAGGWNEEIFHSMLNILTAKINLQIPFGEILEYMFKIHFYSPNYSEPLYLVLRYCRISRLYNIGYYIGKIAEKIIMPTNCTLFVDREIYEYKIKDELSICAYYIKKYQESLELCNYLLSLQNLPINYESRIRQNKLFCEQKLGITYSLDKFKKETAKEIKNLDYRKYFYQYNESEKNMFSQELKNTVDFFESKFNLKVYPVYGTLLGIVRDKDFIAHDTDMDMAYLSNYHTPEEVSKEFRQLCEQLNQYGILMKSFEPPSHIHIYSPSKQIRFDMWISWMDNNNKYYLAWIFDGEFDSSLVLPFNKTIFKNQEFLLINDYEKFLDFVYGKDWKNPISGDAKNWTTRKPVFRLKS